MPNAADLQFALTDSFTLSAWVYVGALPGTHGVSVTTPADPPIKLVAPTLYDQDLYRNARTGRAFAYTFTLPPGLYTVHLKFAELWLEEPGRRPMDIEVNGRRVWEAWDPAPVLENDAGWHSRRGRGLWEPWDPADRAVRSPVAADLRVEDITPDKDGRIIIRIAGAGENDAILQAIEIE